MRFSALFPCAFGVFAALTFAQNVRAQTPTPSPSPAPTRTPAPTPTPIPPAPRPLENPIFPAPPATPTPVAPVATPAPAPIAPDPNSDPTAPVATPTPTKTPAPPSEIPPTSGEIVPTPTPIPAPSGEIVPTPTEITPTPGEITGSEEPDGNFTLESPQGVLYDMERGLALAAGEVTFTYREFVGKAQRGLVDYNTNTATLIGDLQITVRGQKFTGNSLVFNLDSGAWRLSQLQSTFPPEFFPEGTVLEPIYLRDGVVVGENDTVSGENFKFSSCDRDHYHIQSKKIEFRRDRNGDPSKIVLRRNGIYVLGARILALPTYVISLVGQATRRQPLQATFGQNSSDGFFAKSLYTLRDDGIRTDSVLLDALEKRGLGVGLQREFLSGGLLYLYALSGREGGREINARIDKSYRFGPIYGLDVRLDSTQNNEVAGENSGTTNADFTFSRNGARAQSRAVLSLNRSEFSGNSNDNNYLTATHRQNFGAGYSLDSDLRFNRSQFGTGENSRAETLDSTLQITKTSAKFDVFLRTELHNDLVRDTTYQLERLPELTFQSTTERLKLPFLSSQIPGDFRISYGAFNEPNFGFDQRLGGRKDRLNLLYNARQKSWRLAGNGQSKLIFGTNGNFEQAFYSDDTARYNYSYFSNLRGTWGNLSAQFNYAKQRTFGFTPFQFDFFNPGETSDFTLAYQVKNTLRFNVSTGRDIQNGVSRDVIARAQYSPNDDFYLSLGTSFSPENEEFGEIYGNLRFNLPRSKFLGGSYGVGARYSPDGRGLTRANISADLQLGSKLRFQALAGYDGTNNRFDFTQYRLTQDLHCFNLFATYDNQSRELRFDIAIKAFPFADTRFGRTENSEGFGSGVGDIQ